MLNRKHSKQIRNWQKARRTVYLRAAIEQRNALYNCSLYTLLFTVQWVTATLVAVDVVFFLPTNNAKLVEISINPSLNRVLYSTRVPWSCFRCDNCVCRAFYFSQRETKIKYNYTLRQSQCTTYSFEPW